MRISVDIEIETAKAPEEYQRRYPTCAESAVQDALNEFLSAELCARRVRRILPRHENKRPWNSTAKSPSAPGDRDRDLD